jgi:trimethylamine---corrinoid protein Co-methyltransferase
MEAEFLNASQIKRIHEASLSILERTGVFIPHADMLSRFADSGARVDHKAQRVRIPGDLVMKLVNKAGKSYTLCGRDVNKQAAFGRGKRNYNAVAGEASWVERPGDKRRFTTMADVAAAARFGDALDNITIPGAMADPADVPVSWRCVAVAATMIRNTTKPFTFWFHDRASAKYLVDMAIALRGSVDEARRKPPFYPFLEPISPLRFPVDGIELLYETARIHMPVPVGPMAQMGLSAPATIAGTLAQENAEILAGICVTQLISEGMPVCYGGICHAFDMGTTQMIFSGPEQAIFGIAMTQMGKHYGLPVYVNVGLTDAKRPDAQAGLEAGVTLALAAAAGADIFGHMGISGVDQATSLDMLALQNEVIGYVDSAMRQSDFSDEALGLDVIDEVGPGGAFVNHVHTAMHFREELWVPSILDRQYYQAWLEGGAQSTEQRCRRKVEEVLAHHRPEPVSAELDKVLTEIVDQAKRDLGGGG